MGDGISADKKICSEVWHTYQDVPKHLSWIYQLNTIYNQLFPIISDWHIYTYSVIGNNQLIG